MASTAPHAQLPTPAPSQAQTQAMKNIRTFYCRHAPIHESGLEHGKGVQQGGPARPRLRSDARARQGPPGARVPPRHDHLAESGRGSPQIRSPLAVILHGGSGGSGAMRPGDRGPHN